MGGLGDEAISKNEADSVRNVNSPGIVNEWDCGLIGIEDPMPTPIPRWKVG